MSASPQQPRSFRKILEYEDNSVEKIFVLAVLLDEGHILLCPNSSSGGRIQSCRNDDAHGFGVLGNEGRGTADHWNERSSDVCVEASPFTAGAGDSSPRPAKASTRGSHSKQTIFSAALSLLLMPPPLKSCRTNRASAPPKRTERYRDILSN